jgi:hypothetical protein
MKSILQQIITQNKQQEKAEAAARQQEIDNPQTKDSRRNFLKKTALGGITLGGMLGASVEDTIAQTTSKVNKASNPLI